MEQMQCPACGRKYATHNFCPEDGTKLLKETEVAGMVQPFKDEAYADPYGLWTVTTEGDEEGRSVRQLGSYEGYIDEIAQNLADQAFYALSFTKAPAMAQPKTKRPSVFITLGIKSGTWDMSRKDRAVTLANMLKDRPVSVDEGQYYASVKLNFEEGV